ncbi:MAG TPA: BadF/BadG/BcrA/BcrD ATPase family protein [Bryobacteraceae bacterium]
MEVILAIDGGATHTRCAAIDRSGRMLAQAKDGPSNHLQDGEKNVRAILAGLVQQTLEQANLCLQDVECISAGLAGVDYDGYGAGAMQAIFNDLGFERCLVHGDIEIAHAAALGGGPGIVVLAGTGSSILGVDASGRRVKVGGWGPLYGNEGSAQKISERALTAAACAYDGRGPSTALLESLREALDLSDFRSSISFLYGPDARNVASLCEVVYRCAVSGDDVACSIFEDAGSELAQGAIAAACRLGLHNAPVVVSYQGGVAEHCPLLVKSMRQRLAEALPDACVRPPLWKPVIGAYLLACNVIGWKAAVQP